MKHARERALEGSDSDVPVPGDDEAALLPPRARRRFRRSRPSDAAETNATNESLASLHGELVLLREENARLKAAQHRRSDIGRLLGRARSLPSAETDGERLEDDAAQLLVDGLVVRESLLEICEEIERSMVAFGARLNALGLEAADRAFPPIGGEEVENGNGDGHGNGNGHGSPRRHAGSGKNPEQANGHGPSVS
jgi:hypothetical protein